MALYVVGEFLRETRMRKGYTQEEVSFGICTSSSLSRIENGTQMPGRFILEKLFERLGTENNVFNTFVSREEMELYTAMQDLIRCVTDWDTENLEKQIAIVEELTKNASELEHQCLIFAQGELARQRDGDREKAREFYMKAIHMTLPEFDGKNPMRNNLLTFDEITIINAIAILYVENGDIMQAIQLGVWLKEYMEEKIVDGKMKTAKYPMILYNLSYWFSRVNCYKDALEMADLGIDFCIQYGNLPIFPTLVFNKGSALAELGRMEDAKKYLHQAITLFETMKKTEQVQTAIDWCKLHYGIDFSNRQI